MLLVSNLDWFDHNNCSNISRWTLTEAAQLYLILHQSCLSLNQHCMLGSFPYHIIKTTDIIACNICCTVIQISLICIASIIFSLYQTIWAIKTWCIKYDTTIHAWIFTKVLHLFYSIYSHCRDVLSGEGICGVADEQTGFTHRPEKTHEWDALLT